MDRFTTFFNGLDNKSLIAMLVIVSVLIISATAIIRDTIKAIFKLILHYGNRKKS